MQSLQDYVKKVDIPKPLSPSIQVSNRFIPLSQEFPPLPYVTIASSPFNQTQQSQLSPQNTLTPLPIQSRPHSPSSPSSLNTKSLYVIKPLYEYLILTRYKVIPDVPSLKTYTQKLFYNESIQYFEADSIKDRTFYELILIDTQSVDITHHKAKNNSQYINYSKCVIKKIRSPSNWNLSHQKSQFSIPYTPPSYSYEDYRQAWYKAFLVRPYDHSWFFIFHKDCKNDFPLWFHDWWDFHGAQVNIYPDLAIQGFNHFTKRITTTDCYLHELLFHAEFLVPWIWSWSYAIKQVLPQPKPFSLIREFRVKWWDPFSTEQCSPKAIDHYFTTGRKWWPKTPDVTATTSSPSPSVAPPQSPSFAVPMPQFDTNTYQRFLQFMAFQDQFQSTSAQPPSHASPASSPSEDPFGGPLEQDPFEI